MSFSGEFGNSPAVLQLQEWRQLQFRPELSEFCEASISPTRAFFLLLSHQREALLLPLIFGKGPSALTGNDDPSRLPDEIEGRISVPVSSYDQTKMCRQDSVDNAMCATNPAENDSSLLCKDYPIISSVKSFTWGHHGDAYDHFKDSSYREFLIVAGDDDITVHAFRNLEHNACMINSEADGVPVHGKWVEWGPTQSPNAKAPFSHSDNRENFVEVHNITGTERKQHDPCFKDLDSSNNSSTSSKKWLQTFLTEVNTMVSDGKCLARLPAESSLPRSAEVVSFSIYDSISIFLDFFRSNPPSCKVDQCEESLPGKAGNLPTYDIPHGIPEHFSCKAANRGFPYKCSRVFSSSSQRFVGLVLAFSEKVSISNEEDHQRIPSKMVVVVFMLHQWGLQWASAIDLHNPISSSGRLLEWTDFQFAENCLLCLDTSGLIWIWDAETGNFVTQLDVLQSFGMDTRVFCNRETSFVNRDSTPVLASSTGLVHVRAFRRLMVASHSLLLAVIDDSGVVYVISVDECVLQKQRVFNKFVPPSDLGVLASWKIAGHGTAGRKVFPDVFCGQGVPVSSFSNENQRGNCSSGFTTALQKKTRKKSLSESEISSAPIRRIFLPLDRFDNEDPICFSSFGITRVVKCPNLNTQKGYKIVHTGLHVAPSVLSEGDMDVCRLSRKHPAKESAFVGESIGFSFQGCLYLVTQDGLSVILPSVSVSSCVPPAESNRDWLPRTVASTGINEWKVPHRPWQTEVLDRILLYEGPKEAEHVSLKNGWDIRFSRMRRLQLALHYLKSEEIEKSLDTLVDVNLAEEGILRLIFTSVYQYSCKIGGDNEVALASRLLALASYFAIKMVRRYGLVEHEKNKFLASAKKDTRVSYRPSISLKRHLVEVSNSRRLQEMACFLEVIRNLQSRLAKRNRRPGQGEMADGVAATNRVDTDLSPDDSSPIVTMDTLDALEVQSNRELALTAPDSEITSMDNLSLPSSTDRSVDLVNLHAFDAHEAGSFHRINLSSLENARDMITRWEINNLDFKSVVQDALQSGRLPLAVLQLHLHRQNELVSDKGYHDMFSEVREIGRAISYDLFLKGEGALAMATLQRLGEDIETILRQLLFGTVRRSLRAHILVEMRKYGWLGPDEWRIFERISFIERLYPSSSFWKTFLARQKDIPEAVSLLSSPEENNLKVRFNVCDNLTVECDDIDGVVIGVWENVSNVPTATDCEDNAHTGYWACAAAWSDVWDQKTMDRIVLDQPFHMGVHVPWESQLEYHMSHNDMEEVCRLFDVIPTNLLVEGTLKVNLLGSHSSANIGTSMKFPDYTVNDVAEALEPVFMDIPNVKFLRSSAVNTCSSWLKVLMEQELAKKYIFVKEYWDSTAEVMPLLAHAGLIFDTSRISPKTESSKRSLDLDIFSSEQSHKDTEAALHILVLRHGIHHNLPNLLDLYLDHHSAVLDDNSLSSLLEAAGDCQWAKWLLLTRIKSREYEASLSNARANLFRQMVPGSNLGVLEIEEIISTVDDMAEGGGEMAALATLMYASIPMQQCLCSGSVNRHCSSSSQCTIENLRPGLQKFPTLWRTLVAACFGQDADGHSFNSSTSNVFAGLSFSDYVTWRYNIFASSGSDTSLIQMLPCWLPKSIRRLIKLSVQGPLGWQSLSGEDHAGGSFLYKDDKYTFNPTGDTDIHAIKWEQSIQKSVEKMYSSHKENEFGVEHHLHRGRALAAFNHVLGFRALKLKSTNAHKVLSGQTNIQSDVQMMLSPLTQNERSLLSSVMPLAIMHFEDSTLVASCAFLLELCGLSASMLRVDIAALRRISSYYNTVNEQVSPRGTPFHSVPHESDFTASLSQLLADDYMQHDHLQSLEIKEDPGKVSTRRQPSRALITVLQHLENASLPSMDGGTCGLWLSSGNGDGFEFRNQQKEASKHWSLVTAFCQMHHLPLSTRYLTLLANDNDWVGFLTEAQLVGFPIDIVIQVATQEFSDPRLKTHVLTVLKSMQSTRRKTISSPNISSAGSSEVPFVTDNNTVVPMELFGILAHCERQKNPGESLLVKAKDLRWSLLAMIASCFSDVSPLSCLSVWLEITAARETSSIKVNDITSKIANCVGAAVEATNLLLPGSRTLTFHYNRRNPKRKRITEPSSGYSMSDTSSSYPNSPSSMIASFTQEMSNEEEKRKLVIEQSNISSDSDGGLASLSNMVAVLCEQHLFLPLLRAFEMFMPSCSLLPFIRSLQAFSQMRLTEASAHLASFSARIREEPFLIQVNMGKDEKVKTEWTSSTAVKAADAMLSTCPSAYEKRCLLQLLSAADFGDGGFASTYFRRLHWKINLAEPSLRKDVDAYLGNETLDDASLLLALEKNGQWEQARNWARQLESSGASWKSAVHHVTETQAEAMVAEWKEFLWDIPEERTALWNHCQTLFLRHSFPALQAGLFFLKHAEAVEKEIPPKELHEMLLLSLQWLSGTMTQTNPVYPLHLLREIETRVWLLAVESEVQSKTEGSFTSTNLVQNLVDGNSNSIIEQTANIITKMDNHLSSVRIKATERNGTRENNLSHHRHQHVSDSNSPSSMGSNMRMKRRAKNIIPIRRPIVDNVDANNDSDDNPSSPSNRNSGELSKNQQLHEDNLKIEASLSGWEERVGPAELERAVLSLLEFGQMTAAKQLQQKLSPEHVPSELVIVDTALKVAALSSSSTHGEISPSKLDSDVRSFILSLNIPSSNYMIDSLQVLESLADKCGEGCGHGLCRRIIAVTKAARVLGLSFSEAFEKRPLELLQLLSLKAQDSLEEAKLIVQTHGIPPSSIARVFAESFLKGLLAAHRGGYMDSQKEEGPAPLLWRFSDFLKWAELCPSEPEVGHALMRLVMTGQDIPHACEVELLILSHHFYKSSACLDGVDVLVTLAANRVESYVSEGDFSCLARLISGVSNFRALNFILNILIENGQLEVLLEKYSVAEETASDDSLKGFRIAVLTSLNLFNPRDLDAFAMVYNHFDMKHETASLLESRSMLHMQQWFSRWDKDRQNEDLLESMRHLIEAAEVLSSIDAGHKTHRACARASLFSLQIRIPDLNWLELSETNARRAFAEQSRFQEALIVAEAYNLNQPGEWAPVLWNLMLKPDLIEQFVAEFVAVLPLQPSMLVELAKFYRAEVAARGEQSHFSVWLSPGGLPAEWVKHLGRSFRSLLRRTRDLRVRLQLATIATGFADVTNACTKRLDKVPENAGPLILRRGHGGAYLPLM